MEIGAISQFLEESGYPNSIHRKLRPARIFLDGPKVLAVGIQDAQIFIEDWTEVGSNAAVSICQLADPESFDKLLLAINGKVGTRINNEPDSQSNSNGSD